MIKPDFLWGGALAAHQFEGGLFGTDKGLSVADVLTAGSVDTPREITKGIVPGKHYPNHVGIDFYNRYEEDIALIAELGLKCFRTSINWSRIYPKGDEKTPSEQGLLFYDKVFDCLLKHGIQPVITLSHFEMPYHLATEYGGFSNRKTIDFFLRFAKTCFKRYKDKVKYWLTFNEINNQMNFGSDLFGWTNAGCLFSTFDNPEETMYQSAHYQLVASALAVKAGKKINPDFQIGNMIALTPYYPINCHPDNILYANERMHEKLMFCDVQVRGHYPNYALKYFEKQNFKLDITKKDLKALKKGTVYYIGFSYYMSNVVDVSVPRDKGALTSGVENPFTTETDWGWTIDPVGLRYTLNLLYERYEKPLFIVENGFGAVDVLEEDGTCHDPYRIKYLKEHITEMKKAIEIDGVDVMGYTPWGIIDCVSFTTGEMKKRYGMIYVDRNNDGSGSLKRYRKDSFDWYKNLIVQNGKGLL